jgi:predicted regulator of Ras-like GTPase activity (Roadblock/LC7/MglB family)
MLGLFKRMLSKQEPLRAAPPVKAAPVAKPTAPSPLTRAAVPAKKPVVPLRVPVAPAAPKLTPAPAPTPVQPIAVAPPPATNTHVQVALATIAASLPESISHKVPANPDQFVPIPVERVLPQLSQGQVVLTAAELREYAPDFFSALAGHDDIAITLPLGDIVKQLSPEHFGRRSQRRVDLPTDVVPVFVPGTSGVNVAGSNIAKPVSSQSTPVRPVQPTVTNTAVSPAPAPLQTSASRITMSPQALASLGGTSATPSRATSAPTQKAVTPATPAVSAATFSRSPATVQKKPGPAPKITGELTVPLAAVCGDWLDEVRAQLIDMDVTQCQILVPLEFLVPLMKTGRVLFSWQEVASWIRPPLASPPTPKVGELAVELPLKIIAPLFMGQHRNTGQKRLAVDESIPDLFAGGDCSPSVQTEMATAAAAATAAPSVPKATPPTPPVSTSSAPQAPTLVSHVSTPAPAKAEPAQLLPKIAAPAPQVVPAPAAPVERQQSLDQVIGPDTKRLGAKEIVANVSRLPGAAGALLAMSDGLLVTSQLPPEVKSETIAAFLPQMFGRMTQYTKELTLGPLDRLTLSVQSGEWHVFKCPDIYFAVLGKRDEALPLNLLSQVAAELSSQSK